MEKKEKLGILLAILAAALYAITIPLSKLLLQSIPSTLMAGLLYLGAGIGMFVILIIRKIFKYESHEERLTRKDLFSVIAMILLDIAAPILLLLGLTSASAANASLLNNFEIVATALIALLLFKEKINKKVWIGIILITISCSLLSIDDLSSFKFSKGSLFIILAALCWGLENNFTRKISNKDPLVITLLKGLFSGTGSILIGLTIGEKFSLSYHIPLVLVIGFISIGLSVYFYVRAQRYLGAAKTSAYYAVSPFIGTLMSLFIFQTIPGPIFLIALLIMILGAWLAR